MPIREINNHCFSVYGYSVDGMTNGIKRLIDLTSPSEDYALDKRKPLWRLAPRNKGWLRYPVETQVLSVLFEGKQYPLDISIYEQETRLHVHPGLTPGKEPIRQTAIFLDNLIKQGD